MPKCIKWAQENSGLESDKRGRRGDKIPARQEHVEAGAKRRCFLIEQVDIGGMIPFVRVDPVDERLEGSEGLCRGEGAVTCAMDIDLSQLVGIAMRIHDT